MKVLLLTNEYPPNVYGGAGVHVEHLARELARLVAVEVRCFGRQEARSGALSVRGFDADLEAMGAPRELRPLFAAARRCADMNAAGIDADVVHAHTWYTHLAGILAHLAYGLPFVLTLHSLEPLRPWKRAQLGRGYDATSWIERAAIEMASAVIAVSGETRADALRHFAVDPERVHVIHNGIDLAVWRPVESRAALRRHGIDPDRPYALFVGRVTRQKGIVHLVDAIRHLRSGCQVVLCAGAPDTPEIAAEMEAAVVRARAEREGVVWIREMVDEPTKLELYTHAAVFCCPSIYEPFGIINLEAMACETPVVATAVGGIPEVVVDGETGLLVPLELDPADRSLPADPDRFARELARAIDALVDDPARAGRMGLAGRRRAVERFSWTSVAERTRDLYASLSDGSVGR